MIKNYKWLLILILLTVCIFITGVFLIDFSGAVLKSSLDAKNKNGITAYLSVNGMVQLADVKNPATPIILKLANPFSLLQNSPVVLLKLKYYVLGQKGEFLANNTEAISEYIIGAWLMIFCGPILMGVSIIGFVVWTFIIKLRILFYNKEAMRILSDHKAKSAMWNSLSSINKQTQLNPAASAAATNQKKQIQTMLKQIEQSARYRQQGQNQFANNKKQRKQDMIFKNLMHATSKDWVFKNINSLKPGDRFQFRQTEWLLVRRHHVTIGKKITHQLVVVQPIDAQLKTIIVERKL